MRIVRVIIGLSSLMLGIYLVFQSFDVAIISMFSGGGSSWFFSALVGICLIIAGTINITSESNSLSGVVSIIIYFVSGVLGIIGAGVYKDLLVWSSATLILGLIALFLATIDYGPAYKNFYFLLPALIISVLISDLFLDYTGMQLADRNINFSASGQIDLNETGSVNEMTTDTVDIVWPTSDVGEGKFEISSPSGSSHNEDEVIIFYDSDNFTHQVGIEAWDLDGNNLTYFYIDNFEVDNHQVGLGYQTTIDIPSEISSGKHIVRAVQFDESNNITFYRQHNFEMK